MQSPQPVNVRDIIFWPNRATRRESLEHLHISQEASVSYEVYLRIKTLEVCVRLTSADKDNWLPGYVSHRDGGTNLEYLHLC